MSKTTITVIESFLAVAAGGATGAICRHILTLIIPSAIFPLATLSTNIIGSLAIGIFSVLILSVSNSDWLRLFIQVGVLGGFTTFSSFGMESVQLWQDQKMFSAVLYVFLSLSTCLIAVLAGIWLGRLLQQIV